VTIKPSHYLATVFFVLLATFCYGQIPSNDLCENASEIVISENGFALGKFVSDTSDLTEAKREENESCASNTSDIGNCAKTVWYNFYIPTKRDVNITLKQKDSSIAEILVGINVYRDRSCKTGDNWLSEQIISLSKFGSTGNAELDEGWYSIQVSCNEKVRGKVWLELDVKSVPNIVLKPDSFDKINKAGFITESYTNFRLGKDNTLEPEEKNYVSEEYYSVWFKYVIPENTHSYELILNSNSYLKDLKHRVFIGRPNKVQIENIDSLNWTESVNRDYIIAKNSVSFCDSSDLNPTDTLFLLICYKVSYTSSYGLGSLRFEFESSPRENVLPKASNNSSITPDIISLDWGDYEEFDIVFPCDAKLLDCHCKPQIPDTFWLNKYSFYENAAYQVVDIKQDGKLNISNWWSDYLIHIYKGDITENCNLDSITRTTRDLSLCLEEGRYTIIYSGPLTTRLNVRKTTISFNEFNPSPGKFLTPQTSEKLGSLDPWGAERITSEEVNHRANDTTVMVGGVTITGRVSFKEFSLTNTGSLTIYGKSTNFYLFQGSVSKGTASQITSTDYSKSVRYLGYYSSGWFGGGPRCHILPEGDYSLVCVDYAKYDWYDCGIRSFEVYIQGHGKCEIINNEPELAFPINNNEDILNACSTSDGFRYSIEVPVCSDCLSKSKTILPGQCNQNIWDTVSYYFTFKTEENLTFSSGHYNSLYIGDLNVNPSLVLDSTKIINPCNFGKICNLPKGVYTVVTHRKIGSLRLNFEKHRKPLGDFISKSFDFGSLTVGDSVVSPKVSLSCHSNGLSSDLSNQFRGYNYGVDRATPFPDVPYRIRNIDPYKVSTWFTFTTEKNTDYEIQYLDTLFREQGTEIYIYEYLGTFEDDFNAIVANGLDSSKSNFKPFYIRNSWNYITRDYGVRLENIGCSKKRFFIEVLTDRYDFDEFHLSVKATKSATKGRGDFCGNASETIAAVDGTYRDTLSNYCHTYGNSPFEEQESSDEVSSWFKIDARALDKFNLSIQVEGADFYELYAGSCGALTKLLRVPSNSAYFTLTCMGPAKYYIRVLNENSILRYDSIFLQYTISPSSEGCKPYDFSKPLANFELLAGCPLDTVSVRNYSTRGDDIIHIWNVNGEIWDSSFTPKSSRFSPVFSDTNDVQLIVFNTFTRLADTTSQWFLRDTTDYSFDIIGPDSAFCFDSVELAIQTGYPGNLSYSWSYYPESSYNYKVLSRDRFYTTKTALSNFIYVKGADNQCVFLDSFKVDYFKDFSYFRDSLMCQGDHITVTQNDTVNIFNAIGPDFLLLSGHLRIKDTGVYLLDYEYLGCPYLDTISIENFPKEQGADTNYCFAHGELLLDAKDAKSYLWESNQSINRYLYVSEYKSYEVYRTTLNDCLDTLVFTVLNSCPFKAFIPSAFTPDGNELNDGFKPIIQSEYERFEMQVYNRWGAKVYDTRASEPWQGEYQGKKVQNGIYSYQIIIVGHNGERHFKKGTVTVLR
jgi:gliding motility-associated-like protein